MEHDILPLQSKASAETAPRKKKNPMIKEIKFVIFSTFEQYQ